ncbi:MAG: adenylate/guanylate cyclase domain-containing protein [Sphingobacteriales bacterium JAD_PAG50586_3]|nr:MAG: adenylate/guanylate cyclase domain-containing protein [Sphingobacteriales bacterium JAD_PAG50586_3]
MIKQLLVFCVTLLCVCAQLDTYAQQAMLTPIELEAKLKAAQSDTDRVNILLIQVKNLASKQSQQSLDEAIKLNNRAIVFGEKSNYLTGLSKAYDFAMRFAKSKGDMSSEMLYRNKMDKVNREIDKIRLSKIKLLEAANKDKESKLLKADTDLKTLSTDILSKDQQITEKNMIISSKDTVISRQKLENIQKEQALKMTKQESDLKDARLAQQTLATRLLLAISIAIAIIALIILYVFFSNRRYSRKLAKEKERSEELLLNILPASVANELKENGSVKTQFFDNVTVVFSDFVGFTKLAERVSPEDLVQEIDMCYRTFDEITMRHGLEKIKTIGDSYMCAGGLPELSEAHSLRAVKAGIEMAAFINDLKTERKAKGLPFFEIRIGIHCGPVVAGVVGIHKFAYDIWGDSVNIASRLESAGAPGKVNISAEVYELIKNDFDCVHRGKVEAKNKGLIDMYFVSA